jgi:hypothetical protein
MVLRKELFWGQRMLDDRPIEAVFHLGFTATDSGYGVEERYLPNTPGGSYSWVPALERRADLDRLRVPRIQVDPDTTRRAAELAREVFADLLSVRITGVWWWSLGLTYDLVLLRGMQQVMLDMIDCPSFVHELMAFLMEAARSKLDFLEAAGLLSLNTAYYLPPGGFGYTEELTAAGFTGKVRTADMWGFAESQETVGISPEMFATFIFPYQLRLLERFGLASYGCCEPLERRWDTIRTIPRLRKVSVFGFRRCAAHGGPARGPILLLLEAPSRRPGGPGAEPGGDAAHTAPDLPDHPGLPGGGAHAGQPHHRRQPAERHRLGAHRSGGIRARGPWNRSSLRCFFEP